MFVERGKEGEWESERAAGRKSLKKMSISGEFQVVGERENKS